MRFLLVIFTFSAIILRGYAFDYFGYAPSEQETWSENFPECGGTNQSPIHIQTDKTKPIFRKPLIFHGYDHRLPLMLLWNDGHTIDLAIHPYVDQNRIPIPTVSGGNLEGEYEFMGMHFHWGRNDSIGAEHIIDDLSSPMELHIAHRRVEGSSEGLKDTGNKFMVIAVLYRLQQWDGFELLPIFRNALAVKAFNSSIPILPEYSLGTFLGNINPNLYYEYDGSLTTPPCTESTTWIVFSDRLVVSSRQLKRLRQLETIDQYGNPSKILENHRKIQPLNNRQIYFNMGP